MMVKNYPLIFACFFMLLCPAFLGAMSGGALIDAASRNDVAFIQAYQGDVNRSTYIGRFNALHSALSNKHHAAVAALLEKGADPNITSKTTMCGLIMTFGGQASLIKMIKTPLQIALINRDFVSAGLLLKAKANPNALIYLNQLASKSYASTPLCYASANGLTSVACALMQAGADPLLTEEYGSNAYEIGILTNHPVTVDSMKKYAIILWQTQRAAFVAINHGRVGQQFRSRIHSEAGLPPAVIAEIMSYLKPAL